MADANIKIGQQVDQGGVDQSKGSEGRKPEQKDVEGQYAYVDWVVCPYCYTVNEVVADTDVYLWFRCWNCHNYFQY
jgi:hypothetical protein